MAILETNQKEGLVLQPSNTERAEFICSCCGCCCGMLGVFQSLPKPLDFWATNYFAEVNPEICTACGTCVDRCQVDAISIDERLNVSRVNLIRCIGCGNCVTTCPSEAISLIKKDKETVPPKDSESLYEIIAANRKGMLGKVMLAMRLIKMKR